MSFYPLVLNGPAQKVDFFMADLTDPTVGKTGIAPSDFEVWWADVSDTSFTDISADGAGVATTVVEIGFGWYRFTLDGTTRCTNGGVILLHILADAPALAADIRGFVGAMATSGHLSAKADDIASSVVTSIQSGLATAAALDTVDNFVDVEIGTIITNIATLQTSVNTIDDLVDTEIATLTTNLASLQTSVNTIDDFLDTEIADISARLPAALTGGGFIKASVENYGTDMTPLQATTIVEGGKEFLEMYRALIAVFFGPAEGFGTSTILFKSQDGTKTRVSVTRDNTGRTSTLTVDLSE